MMPHDAWMLEAVTQAAKTGLIMAAPLLGALLTAGIVVGIVQVASQLNDMSIGFVPKALLFVVVLFLFGGVITDAYVQFYHHWYEEIPHWVRFR
jgi:flagellar biosynthetic protein FliQ